MNNQNKTQGLEYLKKHLHAQIGRGNRRFYNHVPFDYRAANARQVTDNAYNSHIYAEESVDISMRESDFDHLLEAMGHYRQNRTVDFYIRDQHEKLAFERKLRKKYPALEKAYERYRILLDMIAEGKDIPD